jgi:prepilin-type N-terminal cleavage/methylation domain-containing protein
VKLTILKFRQNQGFTLVELIVSMAVFMVIMMVAADSFNRISSLSSKYSKSEESNIEGVIGLEVIRHDLEQMGFGLPWQFLPGSAISYNESTDADSLTNDAPSNLPRALVALDGFADFSSDFFGVKGSTVGLSKASQRWTYIPFQNFNTGTALESRPVSWPSNNLLAGNKVIAIRTNFNDASDDHILLDKGGTISFSYDSNGGIDNAFLPQTDQQTHLVYGIEDSATPRMPFNRADFFIKVPDNTTGGSLPPSCAPNTGVLYKAVVNHNDGIKDGKYTYIPLLDCVADMQVVLGWDTSNEGRADSVDAYSSLPKKSDGSVTATPAGAAADIQNWLQSPKDLREHLKMVKVYILAQEGKKDPSYTSPATYIVGNDCMGAESSDIDCGSSYTRQYSLSSDQQQYHWKLYRIITRPKNLVSNQRK